MPENHFKITNMEELQSRDVGDVVSAAKISASDTFCNLMTNMISQADVNLIHDRQQNALTTFEKTNEKLDRFNRLSTERYNRLYHHFQNHTKLLLDMKKDLDIVFRRIRNLKTKLSKQYGDAFTATLKSIHQLEESLEAEASYEEEKPETEQVITKTTAIQNVSLSQHQDLNNVQNIRTDNNDLATNMSKGENFPEESNDRNTAHQTKAAFNNKLIPRLSSSDESYGVQDTDTDGDNNSEDDNDDSDDGSHSDNDNVGGDIDDGDDGDYGNDDDNGDDNGDDNSNDNGDDNGDDDYGNDDDNGEGCAENTDNDNEEDSKTKSKETQNSSQSTNLSNQNLGSLDKSILSSNNEASYAINENLEQNKYAGIHHQFSSSDESLESDSGEEENVGTPQENSDQCPTASNEKNP